MPKIAGILMQKSLCKQKTIMFQVWYTSYLEFKVNSIIEKYNISIHEIGDKIILKSHLNHYFFILLQLYFIREIQTNLLSIVSPYSTL